MRLTYMHRALLVSLLLALMTVTTGCPEDTGGGTITPMPKRDMGSQDMADMAKPEDMADMTADMAEDMADMAEDMKEDMAEETGKLAGTWEVKAKADDALIVTLALSQQPGAQAATGTFTMADGETGSLTATYTNETFSTGWTVAGGDDPGQHQLNTGLFQGDGTLTVKYVSPSSGGLAVDVVMTPTSTQ